MSDFKLDSEACLALQELPSYEYIYSLTEQVCNVLANEPTSYRQANCVGEPGGLLKLYEKSSRCLPAVIVPDIHARPDFLKNILNFPLPKIRLTVKQALEQQLIDVICVGDAVHTELYSSRWKLISHEFETGIHTGHFMQDEMILNLSTLCALMSLKIAYPQNFHFLKGNHENILNCSYGGDYAFFKYADEGEMVKLFIQDYYDDKLLNLIARYENLLPLAAYGKNYVISHAEPAAAFTREQLVDAKFDEAVVEGLIWTRNGQVKKSTVNEIMTELLGKAAAKKAFYFTGHRPVKEDFALRQEGRLVQIHNPRRQNIVLVWPNKSFDFEKNILNTKIKSMANQGDKEK